MKWGPHFGALNFQFSIFNFQFKTQPAPRSTLQFPYQRKN